MKMILSKEALPQGFSDLAVGEPVLIREVLVKILSRYPFKSLDTYLSQLIYPHSQGLPDLVKLLKDKHKVKHAVVTNGGTQAISAALYAIKKVHSIQSVYVHKPYWALFPGLIEAAGLQLSTNLKQREAVLLTAPNNPDSSLSGLYELNKIKSLKVPIVFDGAYYCPQYIPGLLPNELMFKGDIQLFSYSKMYGLSGSRIGYAITDNDLYSNAMIEYMEAMTMGVSLLSQYQIFNIEKFFKENPFALYNFQDECKEGLAKNRAILKTVNPLVIDTSDIEECGMFAYCTKGPQFESVMHEAKVKTLNSEVFGDKPGKIRITLALNNKNFKEIIDRINSKVKQ